MAKYVPACQEPSETEISHTKQQRPTKIFGRLLVFCPTLSLAIVNRRESAVYPQKPLTLNYLGSILYSHCIRNV